MNYQKLTEDITKWMKNYAISNNMHGFITGISGGIDSALVSTLSAMTQLPCYCYGLPINSHPKNNKNSEIQLNWLKDNFPNVTVRVRDLSKSYIELIEGEELSDVARANTKSRIRMTFLYSQANHKNCLVNSTGNAIEDIGIKYFCKFGDGAADICPIGDLMKSEVYKLAEYLNIPKEIQFAIPNDGLYEGEIEEFSDEKRIGATYPELEKAMFMHKFKESKALFTQGEFETHQQFERRKEVYKLYCNLHEKGKHKMEMPPIFKVDHSKYQNNQELTLNHDGSFSLT